jgi:16S rRNA (cytosine1402-N4)-methyltransferase
VDASGYHSQREKTKHNQNSQSHVNWRHAADGDRPRSDEVSNSPAGGASAKILGVMSEDATPIPPYDPAAKPHKRRPRYRGTHPRRFEEKYKELHPERYAETVAKVKAAGKTPAGSHRSIMVTEILEVLAPQPGEIAVDATLGYGGHTQEILPRLLPGGRLLGLDADPIELPKTEARLRALGFGPEVFTAHRSNFAGLPQALAQAELTGADVILADLGVSSMQIDDPTRGFSVKQDGPLDMRMNPQRCQPASSLLQRIKSDALAEMLVENSDEPHAATLAPLLAGKFFTTTRALATAIRAALPRLNKDDSDLTVRRVFQALRIAVNDEFSALENFLRNLPSCLNPGGRVAILTFHSGEDRRVKKAFESGFRDGVYSEISRAVIRPAPVERNDNPRSAPAKLRWACRSDS